MQELVSPSGTAGFLPPGHLLSTSPALEQLDVEVLGYMPQMDLQSLVIYVPATQRSFRLGSFQNPSRI